jgi:hypothetical protein
MMKPLSSMTFDEAAAFRWGYNLMRSHAMQLVAARGGSEELYDAIAKLPVPTHVPAGDPPQEPWVTFREYCS